MSELTERLRELHEGDHDRGCEGRCYRCSCNYDARLMDILPDAAAEIDRLQARAAELTEALREWRAARIGSVALDGQPGRKEYLERLNRLSNAEAGLIATLAEPPTGDATR